MTVITAAAGRPLDMTAFVPPDFGAGVALGSATATQFTAGSAAGLHVVVTGAQFAYDSHGAVAGVVTGWTAYDGTATLYTVLGASLPVAAYEAALAAGDAGGALALVLGSANTLNGSSGADVLVAGLAGNGVLNGGAGDDTLSGGPGADVLNGGPGNDRIEGGGGVDQLALTGALADYRITHDAVTDTYTVVDLRAGSPDGTDTVHGVEFVRYGAYVAPLLTGPGQEVRNAFMGALRGDPLYGYDVADFAAMVAQAESGALTAVQVAQGAVLMAAATTSVAVLAYQFFTGQTPTAAGLNYLVSSTGGSAYSLNSSYYQTFNLENRYINFAVNLGKYGEGAAAFAQAYGNLSVFDAARASYQTIFGATPTDQKLHDILDSRIAYFTALGGADTQSIGTKAAVVGWLLSEAVKADVGVFATSDQAYLTDLAYGVDRYAIDLVGTYHGTPLTGG